MPVNNENHKIGERCEVHALLERYKGGEVKRVVRGTIPEAPDVEDQYALVSLQSFDNVGRLERSTLKINSPYLLKMLTVVVISHPSVPFGFDEPLELESPFCVLFHFWEAIQEHHKNVTHDIERIHVGLLLSFMDEEMGSQRTKKEKMVQNNHIEFPLLWTIFKPQGVLYSAIRGHETLYRLDKTVYEESKSTGRRFEVHLSHTLNDGTGLVLRKSTINIYEKESFGAGAPAKITSLPVYPLLFKAKNPLLLEQLEARGGCAQTLTGVVSMQYNGVAEYERTPPLAFYDQRMANYALVWLPFTVSRRRAVSPYLTSLLTLARRLVAWSLTLKGF